MVQVALNLGQPNKVPKIRSQGCRTLGVLAGSPAQGGRETEWFRLWGVRGSAATPQEDADRAQSGALYPIRSSSIPTYTSIFETILDKFEP